MPRSFDNVVRPYEPIHPNIGDLYPRCGRGRVEAMSGGRGRSAWSAPLWWRPAAVSPRSPHTAGRPGKRETDGCGEVTRSGLDNVVFEEHASPDLHPGAAPPQARRPSWSSHGRIPAPLFTAAVAAVVAAPRHPSRRRPALAPRSHRRTASPAHVLGRHTRAPSRTPDVRRSRAYRVERPLSSARILPSPAAPSDDWPRPRHC
jgi:hypothetical protein